MLADCAAGVDLQGRGRRSDVEDAIDNTELAPFVKKNRRAVQLIIDLFNRYGAVCRADEGANDVFGNCIAGS
ncbi:hypothetical protein D3C80_651690 [compost metagenome]